MDLREKLPRKLNQKFVLYICESAPNPQDLIKTKEKIINEVKQPSFLNEEANKRAE